jgi:hypothetical protein
MDEVEGFSASDNESLEANHGEIFSVPFIMCTDGNYSLTLVASCRLSKFSKPISIVTVFGAPRSGKSTLILRSLYSVDPSDNDPVDLHHKFHGCNQYSQTLQDEQQVAFWMWSQPISVPQPDGAPITMLVLESGRGDENILFAIAVLLSTHVLYNGTTRTPIGSNPFSGVPPMKVHSSAVV